MRATFAWLERKGWVVLLGLAAVLFVHGTYVRYEHWRHEGQREVAFEYDEKLPTLPEPLQFSDGTKFTLAVFLPAGPVSNRVRYLGAVNRVHKPNGLRVVGIVPGNHSTVEWYGKYVSLPFEVIGDEHLQGHMAFRVVPSHGHAAIALFDSEGRVKFHAFEVPEEDEIRQVVERYLLGEVDYSYRTRNPEAFAPGKLLPAASFKAVKGAPGGVPETSERLLVFFPPGCSSCQANVYSAQVVNLSQKLGRARSGAMQMVAVFPSAPDTTEWSAISSEIEAFIPEFWVSQDPAFLWDDYHTRYVGEEAEPFVVGTDAEGRVEFAGALREIVSREGLP